MRTLAAGAQRPAPARRAGLTGLEVLYLGVVALAAVVTVDPLEWNLRAHPLLRHLALALTVPLVVTALVSRRLAAPLRPPRHAGAALRAAWPLVGLALLIIGGGIHARLVSGLQNTFLNLGLYMTLVVLVAALMRQTDAPEALARGYFSVLVAAGAVMGALLVANFGVRHVYHEQVFLIIPLAALFLVPAHRGAGAWAAGLFFLSMAWFSQKYTAYLIGALTLGYLGVFVALPRLRGRSALARITIAYWAVLAALGGALAFALAVRSVGVPSGNPEYRLHAYAAAWERFTASPGWGTAFAAEPVEEFKLFTIGIADNVLPTHSDLLDLLAHGGLLAGVLWFVGVGRIARIAYSHALRPALLDQPLARYAHAAALLSAAGVLTYAFNPILLQPGMAYLLWSTLGLLLGLALRSTPAPAAHAPSGTPLARDRTHESIRT